MDKETYDAFFEALYAEDNKTIIDLIQSQRLGLDELFDYSAPIHNAAWTNNAELARQLIELGADVNICKETDGLTPLHAAAGYNHVAVARVLVDNGAQIDAKTKFTGRSQYTWSPHYGETPLHLAVLLGSAEMVKLLLDAGADPSQQDGTSATPGDYLRRLTWRPDERDTSEVKELLDAASTA